MLLSTLQAADCYDYISFLEHSDRLSSLAASRAAGIIMSSCSAKQQHRCWATVSPQLMSQSLVVCMLASCWMWPCTGSAKLVVGFNQYA